MLIVVRLLRHNWCLGELFCLDLGCTWWGVVGVCTAFFGLFVNRFVLNGDFRLRLGFLFRVLCPLLGIWWVVFCRLRRHVFCVLVDFIGLGG